LAAVRALAESREVLTSEPLSSELPLSGALAWTVLIAITAAKPRQPVAVPVQVRTFGAGLVPRKILNGLLLGQHARFHHVVQPVLKAVQPYLLGGLLQGVSDDLLILDSEYLGHFGGHGFPGSLGLPAIVVGQSACAR